MPGGLQFRSGCNKNFKCIGPGERNGRDKRQRINRRSAARWIEGYEVFLRGRFRREQDRYRELADYGQSPKVLLIGCCDSRVSPEVIFDADPGEIFVLRNIANLIPPYAPDGEARHVGGA